MTLETMSDYRISATEKWREYVTASKMHRNRPEFVDLKKIYNQIKSGKKTIDVFNAIQSTGVHSNFHPKLAIAQAKTKIVYCRYRPDGTVHFVNRGSYWSNTTSHPLKFDVALDTCLPKYDRQKVTGNNYTDLCLKAPVPLIPPKYMPAEITDDYYILWEVDKWEMAPPTDPWLLKRITKTVFTVLAGWDLTEIEKSVMRGRML